MSLSSAGVRMQKLREERGWSLRKCAKEISKFEEVSHNAVAKWEKGDSRPSEKGLAALCKCFDVSDAWVLGHSKDRTPPDSIEPPAHQLLAISDDIRLLSASQIRLLKKIIEAMKWENGQ